MQVTIDIPGNDSEAILKKIAIEKLVKNLNKSNLEFIASISERPNVNEKFANKIPFIKTFL